MSVRFPILCNYKRLVWDMVNTYPLYKTGGFKNIRNIKRGIRFKPHSSFMSDIQNQMVSVLTNPYKSPSDKKSYKVIQLENGLTALLISDPRVIPDSCNEESDSEESEEESDCQSDSELENSENEDSIDCKSKALPFEDKFAACALCIGVGSFSDPANIQGMAHFVEHMVFMGSKKYPVENDFDAFIRKKGGSDNALTDCETTNFFFEVQENYLEETMDRFAQFFVFPLMKQEAMQRERESIESEFALAIPSERNRKEQLLCRTLPVGHPARTFMWGNSRSLTPPIGPNDFNLHIAAHKFRERHYSAHRMTVAVQARLPLESLQKYVINTFGQIPTNNLPSDDFSKFIFSPLETVTPDFNSFYYVKPIMQTTNLNLTWCMKSFFEIYKSKPQQYVAWIIGHEGTGSLLVYLQRKVWALGISCGIPDGGVEHTSIMSFFTINLVLTQEGVKNVDKVIDAIFGYINMLRKNCPCYRIYEEIRNIEDINFKFKDEPQPCDNVEELAGYMQVLPPEHYMTGQDLYFEYNPKEIMYVINNMTPETVNIMLQSQNYPEPIIYDSVEEWFGTEFKKTPISPENIDRWKNMVPEPDFHLPEPNPFIPDNFVLITPPPQILVDKKINSESSELDLKNKDINDIKFESISPKLIKKDDLIEVWHKPDYRFNLPYTFIIISFITPLVTESAKSACLLDLWSTTLNQLLTEKLYPADVTGLDRSLVAADRGLLIKLHGFSQKLPIVVEKIIYMLNNYNDNLSEDLFNALKDVQNKTYINAVMKPSKLVKEIRFSLTLDTYWSSLDKLKALQFVSYDDLKLFGNLFLEKLYIKMLMQGNLIEEDSLLIIETVERDLKWKPIKCNDGPKLLINKLPIGERHCRISSFNVRDENSVIANYYQYGVRDLKNHCIIELIVLIMEEPLFDTLRTKEQLGYHVSNTVRYFAGVIGFTITVSAQSGKFSTGHVDTRIEEFLKEFLFSIKTMTEESFEQSKLALIKIKNTVDVELKDEVVRNWNEIECGEYQFNKRHLEIECLKSITLNDIKCWLEDHISSGNASKFKKISLQIVGHKRNKSDETDIDKYTKMNNQVIAMLNECDYSIKYLDDNNSQAYFIMNIEKFKDTLEKYPERKSQLKLPVKF